MGKKYIIELLDKCNSELKGIMLFGLTQEKQISVEMIPEESMTPYTEPDLDAIRNEAYEKGVQDTKQHWVDAPRSCAYKLGYENGLNDAWECARKIILDKEDGGLDTVTYNEIFGYGKGVRTVLKTFTASEAIEKIREYEQKQEKKDGVWIASEANEPSVDTTLICSKCGYAIKIKPHETPALNFCPKCGDCKKPKEEES